ncbi:hypothetical protein CFP56_013570 [Quercus suber]|uniref:Neprosin PEP catalytic domain-containing protein n=1 Tax=Quercus suber TaxID=58331 RepID=A0AAW0KW69_QUESU
MGKRITLIFLFVITFLVLSSVDVKTKDKQNLSEVDRKLMVLNKPAIKSIKMDAYQKTGCINLICSGFVQINPRYELGAPIQPTSQKRGKQYEVQIQIYQVMKI